MKLIHFEDSIFPAFHSFGVRTSKSWALGVVFIFSTNALAVKFSWACTALFTKNVLTNKKAINRFEKALTLIDKNSGQYFSANWFIGKSYSILLRTDGLSYKETDRMFECYEEYLRLQPNAEDAGKIREYVERKKKRRPPSNVLKWVDL